jgi:5'-nucleotidase
MRRRRFLRVAGSCGVGGLFLPEWLAGSQAAPSGRVPEPDGVRRIRETPLLASGDEVHLVILHTNDTHSRMDPFPMDGGPFQGLGGVARRATLVNRIRARHPNVLLLDSGDIFQGTPYFNFFRGEIEFEAMSAMGYDVATIGNHDFDNGVQGLAEMMPRASFDFVSANYEVSGSPLQPHVQPWLVKQIGGIRLGIFGLGIEFEGLVLESLHRGVRYEDPFTAARRSVSELRSRGCSMIICLSHLGYRYRRDAPSDTRLAQEVDGIDLILGGHTHTFLDVPDVYEKPGGRRTLVSQVGWAGMRLGRVDVLLRPSEPSGSSSHEPAEWAGGGYPVDAAVDS